MKFLKKALLLLCCVGMATSVFGMKKKFKMVFNFKLLQYVKNECLKKTDDKFLEELKLIIYTKGVKGLLVYKNPSTIGNMYTSNCYIPTFLSIAILNGFKKSFDYILSFPLVKDLLLRKYTGKKLDKCHCWGAQADSIIWHALHFERLEMAKELVRSGVKVDFINIAKHENEIKLNRTKKGKWFFFIEPVKLLGCIKAFKKWYLGIGFNEKLFEKVERKKLSDLEIICPEQD